MRLVPDDDADVRELLEQAGRRPAVPQEEVRAIGAAARAVWERRYVKRARARRSRMFAVAAAALAIALTLGWWIAKPPATMPPPAQQQWIARVDHVVGAAPVAAGEALAVGTTISTPDNGRVALSIEGRSLRLDAATRVRLAEANVVELQQGAVYLDSLSSHAPITIRTAAGDFTPAGTQFEVRLVDSRAELRVREGVVRADMRGRRWTANAGEEVAVREDGTAVRGTIAPYDARWSWVIDAAPRFEIEGRSLRAFLAWVAREQGRTLRFAGEEVARASETTTLHGSIAHLDPQDGLQTVMLSTGFASRVEDGELIVSKRPSG